MRCKVRSRFAVGLVGLMLTGSMALGQAADSATQAQAAPPARTLNTKLEFDVATVKPSPPLNMQKLAADMQAGKMPNFGPRVDGLRAQYTYMALKELIALAYDVKAYQISGPAWLGTERFDIVAEMPVGSKKDDAKDMLRSLLEERFKLTAHKETQEHPVYALVVAKGGSKMKESPAPKPLDPDAPLKPGEMRMETANGPAIVKQGPDGSATVNMGEKGIVTQKMDVANQALQLTSDTVSMQGFADMLTNVMQMGGGGGRPVVDQTGLKGNYQISLEIPMAAMIQAARAAGVDVPGGAAGNKNTGEAEDPGGGSTIFESVSALGLRLEPTKASVQQLVVDSVEKAPTEN
jgi:uncharacterized protein (TIGR03435 family)